LLSGQLTRYQRLLQPRSGEKAAGNVRHRRFSTAALALLLAGYLFFDRAFAYLHLPGTVVFVGELTLALIGISLLRDRPRLELGKLLPALFLIIFVLLSTLRTVPYLPIYGIDAVRDASLWYYSLVAFFVLAIVNERGVERLRTWYERLLPGFFLWAPVAIVLRDLVAAPNVPDSTVSILSHRSANASVMVTAGIVYYWVVAVPASQPARLRRALYTAVGALVVVVAGITNRGGLVSAVVGLAVAAFLARLPSRRRFASIMLGTILAAFSIFWILDLRLSVFENQREISAEQLAANLTSILPGGSESGTSDLEDTSSWRLRLWESVFRDVGVNAPLSGLGYGVNLAKLYGFQGQEEDFRSTHNSHVSVFARSGWLGAGVWILMWWSWFDQLFRSRRRFLARGQTLETDINSWLIATAAALLVNAIFDPTLEGPQTAAWVWAIFGLGLGMIALAARRQYVTKMVVAR
jgi:hypothetical protein